MTRAALLVAALLGACSSETYVVVTVQARPAVHGATSLRVALTHGGSSLTNTLPLGAHAFPLTFSVSSAAASGDLAITVDALDANMQVVGSGQVTTSLASATAGLTLDPADFVVNTEYAQNQVLTRFDSGAGLQLAATADDTWTVVFRDDCSSLCHMLARRFDATGAPVNTPLAAGTNQFDVTTVVTNSNSTPAVAASATITAAIWDSHDSTTNPVTDGIACRAIDATGNAASNQSVVATEANTDIVAAAGLANGNFALTWNTYAGTLVVRAAVVGPDCTVVAPPITLNPTTLTSASHSHLATSGNTILYAWVDESLGDVHARMATTGDALTSGDLLLLPHSATSKIDYARVAPDGADGFVLIVRWSDNTANGGRIELYRVSPTGVLRGGPTLVTDKAYSDFASSSAPGVATRGDGAILVTWHACDASGDGNGCRVFGRVLRPSGAPVGDAFTIPTTVLANQIHPAAAALTDAFVVAWEDTSAQAPDTDGSAVRARVIYPPFDDAAGIEGATCGDGLTACEMGLVCAAGTEGMRCAIPCPTNACPAGGTCTAGACVY